MLDRDSLAAAASAPDASGIVAQLGQSMKEGKEARRFVFLARAGRGEAHARGPAFIFFDCENNTQRACHPQAHIAAAMAEAKEKFPPPSDSKDKARSPASTPTNDPPSRARPCRSQPPRFQLNYS